MSDDIGLDFFTAPFKILEGIPQTLEYLVILMGMGIGIYTIVELKNLFSGMPNFVGVKNQIKK